MKLLMDFFEELDEMVNVSDADTHEMLYLNRNLRERLGYRDHAAYQGKTYPLVLGPLPPQARQSDRAEPGVFRSYTHKYPGLDQLLLIKTAVYPYEGRRCRLEIAIDVASRSVCPVNGYNVQSEKILNECLQRFFTEVDPEDAIHQLLPYLGRTFRAHRAYIFEQDRSGLTHNTYEWCAEGVTSLQDSLQNITREQMDLCWEPLFQKGKDVIIADLEQIRTSHPGPYASLRDQNIFSMAAGAIHIEGEVKGFFGLDNPDPNTLPLLTPIVNILGYFIAAQLRRRDMFKRLHYLSFRDALTGAYNRNAMFEQINSGTSPACAGVIYCDVTGLKVINDSMGHGAGDRMIRHCFHLIRETLDTSRIYRVGGDEFVALYPDVPEARVRDDLVRLRRAVMEDEYHIASGLAWTDRQPVDFEALISRADTDMYEEKQKYYASNWMFSDQERRRADEDRAKHLSNEASLIERFAATTYTDVGAFFHAISHDNSTSYFFFGDMQKNLFYISDNMRDAFGFESSIVPGLLQSWEKRITSPRSREVYHSKLAQLLRSQGSTLDLRYQVRCSDGRNLWVRSYGTLTWNEDRSKPLFFSGRLTHQDDSFLVDPITNFPKETVALKHLTRLLKEKSCCPVIGFCLNSMKEINSTRGRACGDNLARHVAADLENEFSGIMGFYRLEGMRFLALMDPEREELSPEEQMEQIRSVISRAYELQGVAVPRPASFALMNLTQAYPNSADFLEHMVALINMARREQELDYVDDSDMNIQRLRRMSNMALALSRDVLSGMENFRIVIQPLVSARTGEVIGGETLMRWRYEGEDIPPSLFIPYMEKERMISVTGKWVFEEAVKACQKLVSLIPDFFLTVNVSLYQLSDPTFIDFVLGTMDRYGLDGRHLVVEMTESCMDEEPQRLQQFVDACGSCGILVALDDFGSGYSSLRVLLQYPSTLIKLDRSLLLEMSTSADKAKFISSLVYACHRFGKKVCMEGVETAAQDELVKRCGCDMIQGFFYHRPMELAAAWQLAQRVADPTL